MQRQWQHWGGSEGQGARKLSSTSQLSHRSAAAGAEGDGSRGALLRNDSSFMGVGGGGGAGRKAAATGQTETSRPG